MPRFWTRLVDSLPRDMKSLTWRLPLVLAVILLSAFIFFPFQDTPYALRTVVDTYDPGRGGEKYGKVDPEARVVRDYEVTNRWVWLTSPFHYEDEREITAEELAPKQGRARKLRTLRVISQGLNFGLDLSGGTELLYQILLDEETRESVTAQEIKGVIQKRIDAYGLREPIIQVQGSQRILVQVPVRQSGALENIKNVIQSIGNLEFRLVAPQGSAPYKSWKETGEAPPGYTEYSIPSLKEEEAGEEQKVLVGDRVEMTGEYIRSTRVITGGSYVRPVVGLSFSPRGQQQFAQVTGAHVGERLAIVLNTQRDAEGNIKDKVDAEGNVVGKYKGECYSAPEIEERILGDAIIRGDFDVDEAKALRTVLMAGSLPAPLKLIQENTVGATLGPALVSRGVRAIVIGLVGVVLFMALYYWLAGAIADFALLLNILIIVAVLILFNATLTLPGIAGLLLTVGMSVDANVLIFERIREEKGGPTDKPLRLAIRDGYGRAFWTIFDANLTTLLTAYILYWIGTGAVKGFAIVLSIGILTSMFTALVVTRVVFDILVWRRKLKRLPMAELIKKPQIAFMRLRTRFLIGSGVLIAAGLAIFFSRGEDNWDIDFKGGQLMHVVFREPMDAETIRGRLRGAGEEFADCEVQSLAPAAAEGATFVGRRSREFVIRVPSLSEVVYHEIAPLPAPRTAPGEQEGETVTYHTRADVEFDYPVPIDEIRQALRYPSRLDGGQAAAPAQRGHWRVEPKGGEQGDGRYRRFLIESDLESTLVMSDRIDRAFAAQTLTAKIARVFQDELAPPGIQTLEENGRGRTAVAVNLAQPLALETLESKLGEWELDAQASPVDESASDGKYTRFRVDVASGQAQTLAQRLRAASETIPLSNPIPRLSKVGPSVAREMLVWAIVAIAAASAIIIAYVWLRFERFKYGVAAVAAVVHDVLITIGLLAIFGLHINLPIVAALLTIIGYSINDTIVVFDRIRENLRRQRKRDVDATVIDGSINQMLSRTVLTSATTLLAVLALYLFGGGVIQDFALTLLVGVVVGTYSSIFIASPLLILHQEQIEKRLGRAASS
ncbi:MAG: protein translocase subunit SecD [Candidatus Brocadiia bacterium]